MNKYILYIYIYMRKKMRQESVFDIFIIQEDIFHDWLERKKKQFERKNNRKEKKE